jgi:hypothetical protein
MIIYPWSRANVVNKQFIEQLEKLLKRDVQLLIGYGLGKDEDDKKYPSDIQAEKNLKKLANQYKDNFILKRLGDTHAKIIVSDAKFAVTTSFNWLSFKGIAIARSGMSGGRWYLTSRKSINCSIAIGRDLKIEWYRFHKVKTFFPRTDSGLN